MNKDSSLLAVATVRSLSIYDTTTLGLVGARCVNTAVHPGPRLQFGHTSCCCHPLTGRPRVCAPGPRRMPWMESFPQCMHYWRTNDRDLLSVGDDMCGTAAIPMENPYCSCKLTRPGQWVHFGFRAPRSE